MLLCFSGQGGSQTHSHVSLHHSDLFLHGPDPLEPQWKFTFGQGLPGPHAWGSVRLSVLVLNSLAFCHFLPVLAVLSALGPGWVFGFPPRAVSWARGEGESRAHSCPSCAWQRPSQAQLLSRTWGPSLAWCAGDPGLESPVPCIHCCIQRRPLCWDTFPPVLFQFVVTRWVTE